MEPATPLRLTRRNPRFPLLLALIVQASMLAGWQTVPASADGLAGLGEGSLAGATVALNGPQIGSGWNAFHEVVGGADGKMYALKADDGELRVYHDRNRNGTADWRMAKPATGWQTKYAKISCGADGRLYCVKPDGYLVCEVYTGDGFAPGSGATNIARNWNTFEHIVGGHDGVIYGVSKAGNLHYYKDLARNGGKSYGPNWGARIGEGWDMFRYVFGAWRGIIYGVKPDGSMCIYRDLNRDGTRTWDLIENVGGTRWSAYDMFWGGEDGVIYARKPSGTLHIFRIEFPNLADDAPAPTPVPPMPNAAPSSFSTAVPTLDPVWVNNGQPQLAGHWNGLNQIIGGNDGIVYARVASNGDLRYYKNKNTDGTAAWAGGSKIAGNFNRFSKLFGGWHGRIYGIEPDGTLRYFVDNARDGSSNWGANGIAIGTGWDTFLAVFGGHDGVIYAIGNDDYLYCYIHKPDAPEGEQWFKSTEKKRGWKSVFAHVFGGQNGIIYCVKRDGKMRVYRDKSRNGSMDMDYREDIGTGFVGYTSMWGGDNGVFYGQKTNGDIDVFKCTFGGAAFANVSVTQTSSSVSLGFGGSSVALNGNWVNGALSGACKIRGPFGDVDMVDCALTVDLSKKLVLGHAKLNLPKAGPLKDATGINLTMPDAEVKIGYGRDLGSLVINGTTWETEPDNFYLYFRRNMQGSISFGPVSLTVGPGGNEFTLDLKRFNFFMGGTVNLPPIDGNGFIGLFLGNPLNITLKRGFRTDFNSTARVTKTLPVHMMIGGGAGIPTLPLAGQRDMYLNIDRDGDGKTIFEGDPVTDIAFAIEGSLSLSLGTYGIGLSIPMAVAAAYVDLGAPGGFEILVSSKSGLENIFEGTPFEEFGTGGETKEYDAKLSHNSCLVETRYATAQLAGFRLADLTATIAHPGGFRVVGKFPWPGSDVVMSGTLTGPQAFVLTGNQSTPISNATLNLTSTNSSKTLSASGWVKLAGKSFTLNTSIHAPSETIWSNWVAAKTPSIRFPPLAPAPLPDPPALIQGSVSGNVRVGINPASGALLGRANITVTAGVRAGITDSFINKTFNFSDLAVDTNGRVSFTIEGQSFTVDLFVQRNGAGCGPSANCGAMAVRPFLPMVTHQSSNHSNNPPGRCRFCNKRVQAGSHPPPCAGGGHRSTPMTTRKKLFIAIALNCGTTRTRTDHCGPKHSHLCFRLTTTARHEFDRHAGTVVHDTAEARSDSPPLRSRTAGHRFVRTVREKPQNRANPVQE